MDSSEHESLKDTSPASEIPEGKGKRDGGLSKLMFCVGVRTGRRPLSIIQTSSQVV